MLKLFDEAHTLGAKFGGLWLVANRQAIRAAEQVGLNNYYDKPQIKALLSLAALNILVNVSDVLERRASESEPTVTATYSDHTEQIPEEEAAKRGWHKREKP